MQLYPFAKARQVIFHSYLSVYRALDLTVKGSQPPAFSPLLGTSLFRKPPCTCSYLFIIKHVRLASGLSAFYWNAVLLRDCTLEGINGSVQLLTLLLQQSQLEKSCCQRIHICHHTSLDLLRLRSQFLPWSLPH